MCEIGPINQQQGLKYDQEFGRTLSILETTGISISTSQKEQILIEVKNLNVTPHPQEDLEVSFDSFFQSIKETEESWTTFDGEPPLEPDIEEFFICLSEDPTFTDETRYSKEDDLPSMTEGDMQSGLNEEVNQEHQDYIEHWFQMTTRLKHHSLLQQLSTSSSLKQMVLHILVYEDHHHHQYSL